MTLQASPSITSAIPVAGPVLDSVGQEVGPRLHGVIDVIRTDRIAGWVIDRADPRAYAEVEVRREGRVVATVRADRPRPDLERSGVGSGRYGFAAPLDPPLDAGMEFTLSVTARTGDGAQVVLRPVGQAAAVIPPERRLLERIFEDLGEVKATAARTGADLTDGWERLSRAVERVELVQARLEAALGAVEPLPSRRQGILWTLAVAALLTGAGSLGLGTWSLWWP